MVKLIASVVLRTILMVGIIISLTSTVRAEHIGDRVCPQGTVPYEEHIDYMRNQFGEIPVVVGWLDRQDIALLLLANPKPPKTWTAFILNQNMCMLELSKMQGDDFTVLKPSTGAGDGVKLAP